MVESLRLKLTQKHLVVGRHSEGVLARSGPAQKQPSLTCKQSSLKAFLLAKLEKHVKVYLVISQLVTLIIFIKVYAPSLGVM